MNHFAYKESDKYSIALLVKPSALNIKEISTYYMVPMANQGIKEEDVVVFALEYDALGKATAKFIKDALVNLLSTLDSMGVTALYVVDSAYFKVLTKELKAEPHFGYALPCKVEGYAHMTVVLGANYQALIHNPAVQQKIDHSLHALCGTVLSSYTTPGADIVHSAHYPQSLFDITAALESLHQHPVLTADIEGFSLRFNEAGIGSIAFAWDQHNGVAFLCDYRCYAEKPDEGYHGFNVPNAEVRKLLFKFFSTYQGAIVWHNAAYDLKAIIHALWMKNLLDTEGMLTGLETMTRDFHDTKIVAYLATNSTAGNVLGLKSLAQPFAGNWAQEEIKDIRMIPSADLLRYNLIDALSTHYVKNTYGPIMVQDNQLELYEGLMLSSLRTIIQMELTGMPVNVDRVQEVKLELAALEQDYVSTVHNSPCLKLVNLMLQTELMNKENAKLKKKQHPLEKYKDLVLNLNSGPQLQVLLYEHMGLPVIDYTDTKQPATGADTLKKLVHHTTNQEYKDIIEALVGYTKVNKILTSTIPAFERAIAKGDGWAYLHGNFNLGGTVSGRLSSSEPNLQNIPAGSVYGKLVKSMVEAPDGWLFAGADFNSLEDYISALTTKDPNKLAVYERKFDGHCLRAAYYFRDQLPHIDLNDPKSVNTIKDEHPDLRQESKAPTFLLTYGGTYHGMMANLGWTKEKSQSIEANYHELYKVSDEYVHSRLTQASKDGYVDVAFGLRVRTPLLKQVIFGGPRMPFEAAAEGRTAGNALGQSYGLLNNRAACAFMERVRKSKYRLDIKLVALIHDSIYLMIRDDIEIVEWANNALIEEMKWQDLPELEHPTVKLGANLEIYWPTWANAIRLPNNATQSEIRDLANKGKEAYGKKVQSV